MANDDFNLKNKSPEVFDDGISKDDFKFVQADKKIHDQKFETKPTTFLKDCLRRFRKNKSSVVAAFILGILLLLSIIVPFAANTSSTHDTSTSHPGITYLEPKLFEAGTGFWDGTVQKTDIPVDTSDPDSSKWAPDPKEYSPKAVTNLVIGKESYTKTATKYGKDGFVQFGYFANIPDYDPETFEYDYIVFSTQSGVDFDFNDHMYVDTFDVYDLARLEASDEETKTFPEGYVEAESALYLSFTKNNLTYEAQLTPYQKAHTVGVSNSSIDVTSKFNEVYTEMGFSDKLVTNARIQFRVKNAGNHKNSCALLRSIQVSTDASSETKEKFEAISFVDANSCLYRTSSDKGYWTSFSSSLYSKSVIYLAKATLCSFTYDTYEAALGEDDVTLFMSDLDEYQNKGYIDYYISSKKNAEGKWVVDQCICEIKEAKKDKCPLAHEFTKDDVVLNQSTGLPEKVHCTVLKYKCDPYNLTSMPKFLLGTDKSGRDMLIYVFEGLRSSLLLGIVTTVVCFLFGLLYGSIAGYFGGTVDLIMERFTDILSGIPWVVVMTLVILNFGESSFFVFALALCLTGWIGTAATTRTQFYRFRGREYVLASRTLGASHGRLIAKHILPNAMGTIITSAVLMVPGVIFSEATISYLGLGFKNLASLGVILSDNQVELTNHPYLLIFPSIIIALLMISFNLFGNGLRDAVNPSLKGEGE